MGRRLTCKRRGRVPELTGLQPSDGPGLSAERLTCSATAAPSDRTEHDLSKGAPRTPCLTEKRANGVPRRRRRCYLSVTGVRRKLRLELVKKWGNIALHSVFKTDWSRGVTRTIAARVLLLKYSRRDPVIVAEPSMVSRKSACRWALWTLLEHAPIR